MSKSQVRRLTWLALAGLLLGIAISAGLFSTVGAAEFASNIPRSMLVITSIVLCSVAALVGFLWLLPIIVARCVAVAITAIANGEMAAWIPTAAGCVLSLLLLASSDVLTHGFRDGWPIKTIAIIVLVLLSPAVLIWAARGHAKTQTWLLFALSLIVLANWIGDEELSL